MGSPSVRLTDQRPTPPNRPLNPIINRDAWAKRIRESHPLALLSPDRSEVMILVGLPHLTLT